VVERLIVAAPDGWDSPSARYRLGPVARAGPWRVDAVATGTFPGAAEVAGLLELAGPDAALVLQRVLPSRGDVQRLRHAYRQLVFDIDDAIYAVPPDLAAHPLEQGAKQAIRLLIRGSRTASSRKRPLQRVLTQVDACVAGNSILADFARRHAPRVVEIPTTVEPEQQPPATRPDPPVVVWLGLRSNLQHLALTADALRVLSPLVTGGRPRRPADGIRRPRPADG
jgi:hypothetical protein